MHQDMKDFADNVNETETFGSLLQNGRFMVKNQLHPSVTEMGQQVVESMGIQHPAAQLAIELA